MSQCRRKSSKRVAIIGAGCSGLAAIKSCLDEGMHPVCFEKEEDIGGLWNYASESKPGKGSIYKSCTINTSKEMMAFSDFPVPKHYPSFMQHSQVLEYFQSYAEEFGLRSFIRFGTSVENVLPTADFEESGQWELITRRSEDTQGEVSIDIFDAVMICTGHHIHPHIPHLPGLDNFQGVKMHSHSYKVPDMFAGKRVLIVGLGNSAVDIAVDTSRVAKQVYVSTRRGAWIVGRMGPFGLPADMLANSRCMFKMPRACLQWMVECIANFRFDHDSYGVKPKHRSLQAHPTINDDLPIRIMTGHVQIRPDIESFTETGVTFADQTTEEIDAVILATGYDYKFRFVDESILGMKGNEVELYKYVFPPRLQQPTLAVIGLVQAIGAVMPISEIQCRWFTKVIKGEVKLPEVDTMLREIEVKRDYMRTQYLPSRRHTLETFWIEYMDDIAEKIGALPKLWKLALTNPGLAARCFFGPCVPAQYRLMGPQKWEGAPSVIKNVFSNHSSGMKRRHLQHNKPAVDSHMKTLLFVKELILVAFFFAMMGFLFQIFFIL